MPYFFTHGIPPVVSLSTQRIALLAMKRRLDDKPELTDDEQIAYYELLFRLEAVTTFLGSLPTRCSSDAFGR